jgi:predicted amidohydrolase
MKPLRVNILQTINLGPPKNEAIERAMRLFDQAPPGDLFLLPELWSGGAFDYERFESEAEPLDGPLTRLFRDKAAALGAWIHMGSFIERDAGRLFNTSVLIGPDGEIQARYRKIHLFGYESKERELLTAGNEIVTVETEWGVWGLATCYDLRFPELFRRLVDRGAVLFLVAAAWPQRRLPAWRLFNQARAHENLAWLVSCNAAGSSVGMELAGHGMVVDPLGQIPLETGAGECVVSIEIDLDLAWRVRSEFPALRDRVLG